MTILLINKMSVEEKVRFILQNGEREFVRRFCGVTPSKFLMLEVSTKHTLKDYIQKKIEKMSDEEFQQKVYHLL